MNTEEFSSAGEGGAEAADRLAALNERRHELREKLLNCRDQESRIRLVAELDADQEEIARLTASLSVHPERDAPSTPLSPPPLAQSPWAAAGSSQDDDRPVSRIPREAQVAPPPSARHEEDAPRPIEELRRSSREASKALIQVGSDRDGKFPILPIIVVAGALAVLAWFLFLRSPDSPVATEDTTGNIDTEAPAIDQVQAAVDGLGYGSVVVEERTGTLHLSGVVASDNNRTSVIAVVQALAGNLSLDSSGLSIGEVEGSTGPPSSQPEAGGGDPEPSVEPVIIDGPYVEATLDGRDFVLIGAVPSAELANSYIQAAQAAFSPYFRSQLAVDEQLEQVEWLSSGPQAVLVLPMLIDGMILIAEGQVQVSGQSPNDAVIERLQGALGQITGLPVVVDDVQVTDLDPPTYVMAADAGVVELSGQIPTEEIRDMLVDGAVAAYGTGNVVDRITVDSDVYSALWMHSGGPLMQAMSTFPDYELRIDGMAFSGFINGGVTFEPGSATFSGDYAGALDVGVSVLSRDPSLQLVIEGHTDDRGSDDANLALSQRRADAVRDYFITNGIDPSRLTAIGFGESDPVVPNDSEEGRARNRRIHYVLSTGP